jgi:hypothetical protein
MPTSPTPSYTTPFGKNVYLRSTRGLKFKTYMCARETVPYKTIDGARNQQILQPGTVMAKITGGPDVGKVGPFQAAGSGANEVQTLTKGGTWSGGTYTITLFPGVDGAVTTSALAYDATAATVQAAVRAALATSTEAYIVEYADSITVTGGPLSTTALTITFVGSEGLNVPQATADITNVTGTSPTVTGATTTAGVAGALDGRQTLANIVGINDTFLPAQLMDRDVEIAVLYDGAVVQANCFELDAGGAFIALNLLTFPGITDLEGEVRAPRRARLGAPLRAAGSLDPFG